MPEHETRLVEGILFPYLPECSCGWCGPPRFDVFSALRDRYDHLIATGIYELPERAS